MAYFPGKSKKRETDYYHKFLSLGCKKYRFYFRNIVNSNVTQPFMTIALSTCSRLKSVSTEESGRYSLSLTYNIVVIDLPILYRPLCPLNFLIILHQKVM